MIKDVVGWNIIQVKRIIGSAAVYIFIAAFAAWAIFPIYWIASMSFTPRAEIFSEHPELLHSFTIENYINLFTSARPVTAALLNSTLIASLTTLIVVIVASLSGYALARFELKYKNNFYFFVFATRIIPPAVFVVPYYIMYTNLKLYDTVPGMILAYTFINLPFAMWLMRQFFEEIPRSYEEAALIDGCSYFGTFIRVAIPLSLPVITAVGIFTFMMTWNEFLFALILTRYKALTYTAILPGFFGERRIEWDLITPLSTIAIIPPIIFAILARKYLVRGLTAGLVR